MAVPDPVNPQITDSVTQVNTKVVGEAPAVAMGNLYQAVSQASGVALQNAVHAQNGQVALNGAATTEAVNLLLQGASAPTPPVGDKLP